jgi:biopolymer transport protein ExbD
MAARPQSLMTTNNNVRSNTPTLAPRPLRLRVDTHTEDVRIEVVPLIDVIFCILTFFILAALNFSRQQAISVDIPKATTGTPQGRELLVVTLNDQAQVFVDKQPVVTKAQFQKKLEDYRKQSPNGVVALYASTNATYNEVVQVLDLLREIAGDRVALATLPGSSTPQTGATPAPTPTTTVPGVPPYPGTNPNDPYGLQNPANQLNPNQQQLAPNVGQPQLGTPGTTPSTLPPLPAPPSNIPATTAPPPIPGAPVPPNTNNPAPKQNSPANTTAPAIPGAPIPPNTNKVAPKNTNSGTTGLPPAPATAFPPNPNNPAPGR